MHICAERNNLNNITTTITTATNYYIRKHLGDISCTSRVIANFVTDFVAMATRSCSNEHGVCPIFL